MNIIIDWYKKRGLSLKEVRNLNKELKLPKERLSKFARPIRKDTVREAISWPKGLNQEERITPKLYTVNNYTIGVAKPGKEAAINYKGCRNYKTGEKTNNQNDMLPLVLEGKNQTKSLTFQEIFERIEHLMHSNLLGLDLLGCIIFRNAFMLDHKKDKNGCWRYNIPKYVVQKLEKRMPRIKEYPLKVFLYFLEVLALNEDVKMYTLGHDKFKDYGRINTLLTFAHLIAVFLNRRSLSRFAGTFARPPSGIAALPKTKGGQYFPLLSREFIQTKL